MANKSLKQTIKETTPQDLLLTGIFVGIFAALSGAGNWVDKNITGYMMGFKSTLSSKQLLTRGAVVGGVISLPFAYISATSVLDGTTLGSTFVNPTLKGELPPAPRDYVYMSKDGEQPYLILDPKHGL
jgi:hypothetical protein